MRGLKCNPLVIAFSCRAPVGPFSDKKKRYNLKMLVTRVDPLNVSKACAIFSLSVVPHACPAHSLPSVRFRHTVSGWAPQHHSSTSGSCIDFLNLWFTDWLAEAFWDIMRSSAKHAGLYRHVQGAPIGPISILSFPKKKNPLKIRTVSRAVCRPSAVLNRVGQQ